VQAVLDARAAVRDLREVVAPEPFCSGQLNGQWSVETTERTSLPSAFQRCSWFSFARGGGV